MMPLAWVEKPNPPAPFPAREGGAWKPLPAPGRGLGRGQIPPLINQQYHLFLDYNPANLNKF